MAIASTILAFLFILAACGSKDETAETPQEAYENNCAMCHGQDLSGGNGGPPWIPWAPSIHKKNLWKSWKTARAVCQPAKRREKRRRKSPNGFGISRNSVIVTNTHTRAVWVFCCVFGPCQHGKTTAYSIKYFKKHVFCHILKYKCNINSSKKIQIRCYNDFRFESFFDCFRQCSTYLS